MVDRIERSPLSREVAAHLDRVAKRGKVLPTDVHHHGGIHGTSSEAVEYISVNGVLLGRIKEDAIMHYQAGDISFFPTRQLQKITDEHHVSFFTNPLVARKDAVGYARDIAQHHGLLTKTKITN